MLDCSNEAARANVSAGLKTLRETMAPKTSSSTPVPSPEARARAHTADASVRAAAAATGEIDVAVGTLDSPIGELFHCT